MEEGKIYVGKYDYKTKNGPIPPNCIVENIHVDHPLSPYVLKTREGYLIENVWQFSKVYSRVDHQEQWSYVKGHYQKVKIWDHPSQVHIDLNSQPNSLYYEWRNKGFQNPYAIRYPNGYHGRNNVKYSLWRDNDHEPWEILDYIQARKKIYFALYKDILRDHPYFLKLKNIVSQGGSICINEVDGPSKSSKVLKGKIIDDYCIASKELLVDLMEETCAPFGHGYTIAALLLDMDF